MFSCLAFIALSSILALLLGEVFRWVVVKWRQHRMLSSLPGPSSASLLTTILSLAGSSKDGLDVMVKMGNEQREAGNDFVSTSFLGRIVTVPLNGRGLMRVLESTTLMAKGQDYNIIKPLLGESIFKRWKENRRILTNSLSTSSLQGFAPIMNNHVNILVKLLGSKPVGGLSELLKKCQFDMTCETLLGSSLDLQLDANVEYLEAWAAFGDIVQGYATNPFMWIPPIWTFIYKPRFLRAVDTVEKYTKKLVNDRIELRRAIANFRESRVTTFLDRLLDEWEEDRLGLGEVREHIESALLAAVETTSTAVGWLLWCLATNPEAAEKVTAELYSVFGESERICTFEDAKSLVYLEACYNETLRLFPAAPLMERSLEEDFRIGEHSVPDGTEILIMPYVVHRNPQAYPDPLKFDPDRFTPESIRKRNKYDFIPFAAGPRNCVGERFSRLSTLVMASGILRRFFVSSIGGMATLDLEAVPRIILTPKGSGTNCRKGPGKTPIREGSIYWTGRDGMDSAVNRTVPVPSNLVSCLPWMGEHSFLFVLPDPHGNQATEVHVPMEAEIFFRRASARSSFDTPAIIMESIIVVIVVVVCFVLCCCLPIANYRNLPGEGEAGLLEEAEDESSFSTTTTIQDE